MDEREQLGEGWTKDKEGKIYDPDGFVWYGKDISTDSQLITNPDEVATIMDEGSGGQRVIRIFEFKHASSPIPKGEDVYKAMLGYIKNTCFKSGITFDENHEPKIHQDKQNLKTTIIIACKPVGTRASIHEGMKDGQGSVFNQDGLSIVAHKVDNVSKLLNG